jgi:NitT/TauT family transport system ATP-binding protein
MGPVFGAPGLRTSGDLANADHSVVLQDIGMTFNANGVHTEAIGCVNASVGRGRFISVIGPSGCGKSTLLDLVCGLQRPTSGSVFVRGALVKAPRTDTAMVFQEDSTLHWRTVRENVAFGLEVAGVGKRERRARAEEMIGLVGLKGFEDHRPRQLSGGMKQRVAIARALVSNPEILLMDEPFGALDQQTRWMVGRELTRIWDETRKSVLFVTHDIQEAVLLSDEVWVLSHRPSRVKEVMRVDLPRPRPDDVARSPEFHEYTIRLWDLLSEEFSAS